MATIPTTLAEPIVVANLTVPPDVAKLVEEINRERGYTRSERAAVIEDIKLRHHFGGHYVLATAGRGGLQIHAIDLATSDEIHELNQRLYARGHRHVFSLHPEPWTVPEDQIITVLL
jgi:hypothetical protein